MGWAEGVCRKGRVPYWSTGFCFSQAAISEKIRKEFIIPGPFEDLEPGFSRIGKHFALPQEESPRARPLRVILLGSCFGSGSNSTQDYLHAAVQGAILKRLRRGFFLLVLLG